MVISLSAKGLTHGEISAHLAEVYGAEVSKQTITAITDRVMEGMAEWQNRPLDPVYAIIFIDAINVKIREGQVASRPIYLALGVTADGERDVLGLWAGEHGDGEGAKYWLRVLPEIKNRGVRDVYMLVCDGLKGLPDAVSAVWEKTIVQTCIVHLLRNSFKYASKRDWARITKDLKPVYNAASEAEALDWFAEFSGKWEKRYPVIIRLWENARAEFVAFLRFDREIRTVICTTDEWGNVYLDTSAPRVGRSWTDNGRTHEERKLKHRPAGTVRPVPVPPALVRLIRAHVQGHGTTSDGRLFRGIYGGDLSESTYGRVWEKARAAALTPAQVASPLAKRPYDLRHACVSTWLKAGTEPKRVAEWAGHSVDVLLRIYTHCLDGGEDEAGRRIQQTLEDG